MKGFNEYDTFTYEKGTDFTKSFDEATDMNTWAGATAQAAENGKVRLANAQQTKKDFEKAQKVSLTWAKGIKEQGEKRDTRLMNEAYQLH